MDSSVSSQLETPNQNEQGTSGKGNVHTQHTERI